MGFAASGYEPAVLLRSFLMRFSVIIYTAVHQNHIL